MQQVVRRKFCTSCQTDKELVGGEFRYFGNAKRWICGPCMARRLLRARMK